MGCGVLMGGWVGGGWVSNGNGWVCGMRLDCVFCCFCFSVIVVLVFYCVISGVRRWWGWLVFLFCIFIYCWFF